MIWSRRAFLESGFAVVLVAGLARPAFAKAFSAADWSQLGPYARDIANGLDHAITAMQQKPVIKLTGNDLLFTTSAHARLKEVLRIFNTIRIESGEFPVTAEAYREIWRQLTKNGTETPSHDQGEALKVAWINVLDFLRQCLADIKGAMGEIAGDEKDAAVSAADRAFDAVFADQTGLLAKLHALPAPSTRAEIDALASTDEAFNRLRTVLRTAIDALGKRLDHEAS